MPKVSFILMISRIFLLYFFESTKANMQVLQCVYSVNLCVCVCPSLYIIIRLLLCHCDGGRVSGVTLACCCSPAIDSIGAWYIFVAGEGHWAKCKWLWQKLQSYYQNIRSVCRQSVELETPAYTQTHTYIFGDTFTGNSLQLLSLPIFSAVWFFGKFPQPTIYTSENFGISHTANKLINFYASIYYILDVIT